MPDLKRDVVANIAGNVWMTALAFVALPVQVRILGLEAYGLLGFAASLQAFIAVLDLGFAPALARELAVDASPDRRDSRDLVRTLFAVSWATAAVVGLSLAGAAGWLAHDWLRLPGDEAPRALRWLALSAALRWPVVLCVGALTGLQRFPAMNALSASVATVRQAGGIGVLVASRSLEAFVVFTAAVSALELVAFLALARAFLPAGALRPGFSARALARVWRLALGLNLGFILSIAVTQADRLVAGRLLPPGALGCYMVASSAAMVLQRFPGLVTTALYPPLAADWSAGDREALARRYARAADLIAAALSLPAAALVFYGHDVLRVWVSQTVADGGAGPLALLAAGSLLWGITGIPWMMASAAGRPALANIPNLALLAPYLAALWLLTSRHGADGAALAWLALNAAYLVTLVPVVHAAVLRTNPLAWLGARVLPYAALAALCFGAGRLAAPAGAAVWAALAAGALLYAAAAGALLRRRMA